MSVRRVAATKPCVLRQNTVPTMDYAKSILIGTVRLNKLNFNNRIFFKANTIIPTLHPPGRPVPLAASLIGHASQHALPRRRGEPRHDTYLVYGDSSVSIGTYLLLSCTCCHCYSSLLVPVPG